MPESSSRTPASSTPGCGHYGTAACQPSPPRGYPAGQRQTQPPPDLAGPPGNVSGDLPQPTRPPAAAQPGQRTPQSAWPSAPARARTRPSRPNAPQPGGRRHRAAVSSPQAAPREPRTAASASAQDPDAGCKPKTPPAGHPRARAGQAQATARPPAGHRGTNHARTGRRAVSRTRRHQTRHIGGLAGRRSSPMPASRGSPARAGPTIPRSPGRHRQTPRSRNRAGPVTRRRRDEAGSRCSGRTGGPRTRSCSTESLLRQQAGQPRRSHIRRGPVGFRKRKRHSPVRHRSRTCCRCSVTSREPPTVNQYGEMARRHWARWLPDRLRGDREPGEVLHQPGEPGRGEDHHAGLGTGGGRPAGRGVPGQGRPAGEARHRAEQIVLHEMILLQPEPGTGDEATPGAEPSSVPAARTTWPRRARSAGCAPTSPPCRCCAPFSRTAVPPPLPSRKYWPAGPGGARCRRCSMTAAASSPGHGQQLAGCCRRRSWQRPGGTR